MTVLPARVDVKKQPFIPSPCMN